MAGTGGRHLQIQFHRNSIGTITFDAEAIAVRVTVDGASERKVPRRYSRAYPIRAQERARTGPQLRALLTRFDWMTTTAPKPSRVNSMCL